MSFFARVFGFEEMRDYPGTQSRLLEMANFRKVDSKYFPREHCELTVAPGRTVNCGIFSTPSVAELHKEVADLLSDGTTKQALIDCWNKTHGEAKPAKIYVTNIAGESNSLHSQSKHLFGTFQAASQFNYLEFPSPSNAPEDGINGYAFDRTQGPACAIACAAGTAYRNYLVMMQDGIRGQSRERQFNGLADVETALLQTHGLQQRPWKVKNGYIETSEQLMTPAIPIFEDRAKRSELIKLLRIGVVEDAEVTNEDAGMDLVRGDDGKWVRHPSSFLAAHGGVMKVTQTYNSAVSIGYSRQPSSLWHAAATFVLDATYEATMLTAIINNIRHVKAHGVYPPVLLTKIGGGVFRNDAAWIKNAIEYSCTAVKQYDVPLDVQVVHYGEVEPGYETFNPTF